MVSKKYQCSPCDYETNDSGAWCRHKQSHKHQLHAKLADVIESKYPCQYCEHKFTTSSNLGRHLATCKARREQELVIEAVTIMKEENREKELELTKKLLAETNKALEKRDKDFEYMKRIVEGAGILANKSLSALNYSNVYYKDAPKLLPMDDDAPIMQEVKKEDDDEFVERLIYRSCNKTLARFIGMHIVYYYRKNNPVDQSMWTSDVVRLNYIIKESSKWVVDKKGVKMCESIIKPILDNIKIVLKAYEDRWFDFVDHDRGRVSQYVKINMKRQYALDIIAQIDQGLLMDEINRYIAPYFQMRRDDDLQMLELDSESEPNADAIRNIIEGDPAKIKMNIKKEMDRKANIKQKNKKIERVPIKKSKNNKNNK